MRTIRVHESGGIDTMRLDEIPRPVPESAERLTCRSARISTSRMRKSLTVCWVACPTSPERSCSRSQTDHQAELADALIELRTEPHLGLHPRLVEEVGQGDARR
jgi:hypothetical protein